MYSRKMYGETVFEMIRSLSQNRGCGSHIAIYILGREIRRARTRSRNRNAQNIKNKMGMILHTESIPFKKPSYGRLLSILIPRPGFPSCGKPR